MQVLKRPAQISRRHPRQSLATSSVARGRRSRWARHAWRAAATSVVALPRHMRKGLANPAASEATHASRHAESNSQKSKGAALARPQWPIKFVRDEISAQARARLIGGLLNLPGCPGISAPISPAFVFAERIFVTRAPSPAIFMNDDTGCCRIHEVILIQVSQPRLSSNSSSLKEICDSNCRAFSSRASRAFPSGKSSACLRFGCMVCKTLIENQFVMDSLTKMRHVANSLRTAAAALPTLSTAACSCAFETPS